MVYDEQRSKWMLGPNDDPNDYDSSFYYCGCDE